MNLLWIIGTISEFIVTIYAYLVLHLVNIAKVYINAIIDAIIKAIISKPSCIMVVVGGTNITTTVKGRSFKASRQCPNKTVHWCRKPAIDFWHFQDIIVHPKFLAKED